MPEMANAGEDHGHAKLVGGGDDLVVPNRTTGLDHSGCARRGHSLKAIREGEEGV